MFSRTVLGIFGFVPSTWFFLPNLGNLFKMVENYGEEDGK